MFKVSRAEIVPTGSIFVKSARIIINRPAGKIFDLIADPRKHIDFDGSGHLQGGVTGPERLSIGSKFGMAMKWKAKYRILNTVVEFEKDKQIAWSHFMKHRWRYELRALDPNITEVTETFDGRTALFPPVLFLIDAYRTNQKAVLQSLVRLKELAES